VEVVRVCLDEALAVSELSLEVVALPLAVPVALAPVVLLVLEVEVFALVVVHAFEFGFDLALLGAATRVVLDAFVGGLVALLVHPRVLLLPGFTVVVALHLEFDLAHLVPVLLNGALRFYLPFELDFALAVAAFLAAPAEGVIGVVGGVRVVTVPAVRIFFDVLVLLLDDEVTVRLAPLVAALVLGLLQLDLLVHDVLGLRQVDLDVLLAFVVLHVVVFVAAASRSDFHFVFFAHL